MMPMRIRRKSQPIEKLENPTALQRHGRSFPRDDANQITLASTCGCVAPREGRSVQGTMLPHRDGRACPGHPRLAARQKERGCPGHRRAKATPSFGRLSLGMTTVWFGDGKHAKLLRGQALPDMRDSDGKVTEYCGKSRLETPESVNFFEIGPKFLAAQRHTF
ncbi:bll7417 [Bradyrhizobium diazoefficiens USDA 110]|uniref:Bll7417 protein n=2 Tax=Nitrobacteraceae TaxID=41294 RepID=Q89DM2_BRADU|nr:hypothetical protein CO678_31580 [Bradyrhizobium diazoefficiens]QBP26158.1 hypothetical protein Bdiaspc4_39125 [Bradyrhizobium diazoefficiens]BAC52682.1 bll7417 [Bradyrhizobium diazoefficiens USDA 110]